MHTLLCISFLLFLALVSAKPARKLHIPLGQKCNLIRAFLVTAAEDEEG